MTSLLSIRSVAARGLLVAFLLGSATLAADATAAQAPAASTTDYPLQTCVVSGEELGSMGAPFDYLHQEEGKPDRLVRLCCDSCLKKFKKDPARYLALIDAAKSADAANGPAAKPSSTQPACCAK